MGRQIAAVLGNPAVVVTLEEYYSILKKMKDGPIDSSAVVKEEIDDDNITDVSAAPDDADTVLGDGEGKTQGDEAATSPREEVAQGEQSETEAPATPVSTKKRRIGTSLKELMTKADDLKVCPVCWVHHADFNCPRAAESEALYTALAHLLEGGAVPIADSSEGQTTTNVGPVVTETGGADMDVDTQGEDIGDTQERPTVADPQDYTDVEIDDSDIPKTDEEPPTIAPKLKPRAKSRPIQKTTSNKMSIDESNAAKSVKFLDADEDVSPLGKPRESESVDMSNVQQLKNQVPQFLEYASPRPFNSGHFVNSEGAVDWTRGKPPLTGRVRNLRALEMMVATLQRDEDREGIDYDCGGTSQYLDQKHEQNLVASLIDNGTGRIRFIDQSYHCFGKWGYKNCEFLADEIYHAGKRLSIWLRHMVAR